MYVLSIYDDIYNQFIDPIRSHLFQFPAYFLNFFLAPIFQFSTYLYFSRYIRLCISPAPSDNHRRHAWGRKTSNHKVKRSTPQRGCNPSPLDLRTLFTELVKTTFRVGILIKFRLGCKMSELDEWKWAPNYFELLSIFTILHPLKLSLNVLHWVGLSIPNEKIVYFHSSESFNDFENTCTCSEIRRPWDTLFCMAV